MHKLVVEDFDFGTDDETEVEGLEDPTPEELEAFWAWVAQVDKTVAPF